MEYRRFDGETDDELIYRITGEKDKIGSWQDVADILNELLGTNYGESKFRKQRQAFDSMYFANEERLSSIDNRINDLKTARIEFEKEKIKFRDERNEYNKIIRQEARKESYKDLIIRTIEEHTDKHIGNLELPFVEDNGNDLIIHLTDIHTGIEINSGFNQFNQQILAKRLNKYLNKILEISRLHESQNAYVIISEVVSGLIHENLRCENNQNLIEQFLTISDYLTDFLDVLSECFNMVNVYVTPGNHSRISPKKEQNLKGENFDHLLIPYLSAKLQNVQNIYFFTNDEEESIAKFVVRGNLVMASHGDKDSVNNVVQNFSLLFGQIPSLVYLGHRHTSGLTTVFRTKVIQSGCICGADNYAIDHRLYSPPEQTVSVIDEDGLECLYYVDLSEVGD